MKKGLLAIALFLVWASIASSQSSLPSLDKKADYEKFMSLPLSGKYGQVYSVKIIYDIKEAKLYFVNAKYNRLHYPFCKEYLGYSESLGHFNDVNYSNDPERMYLLGNLNYVKTSGKYMLELSSVDMMKAQDIVTLFEYVKNAFYEKDQLYFLVNTSRLQKLSPRLKLKMPLLTPSDIYGAITYQAISIKNATGNLRFIDDFKSEKGSIKEDDIIVLNEVPLFLPRVAGVILTEFQTPLSHMSILGLNRKIPIIAHKNAFADEKLLALKDQRVRLRVYSDSFRIYQVPKTSRYVVRHKTINLKYNLAVDSIIEISKLAFKAHKYVGNKAANFGILYELSADAEFKCPESAFAIPFRFYLDHANESGAQKLIEKLIFNSDLKSNPDSLPIYLKEIRRTIKNTPISTKLLQQVEDKIRELGSYTRMRFRSSTNAEDAFGFSGAGIYSSSTGILGDSAKSIEKAIQKVWASLWSFEAYSERKIFNINHSQVFMGVLVHRGFPSEKVNGVAITKNLYRKNSYGFVVNAQVGEESVVNPKPGVICDQFICYPNKSVGVYSNKNAIDIITKSNRNRGKLVMTDKEIENLAEQLRVIKSSFYYRNNYSQSFFDFGMGVEFKLDGAKRTLYIKQARYYNN